MTLELAVLGAGRIGQVHAKAIASISGAHLYAIADAFDAAAQKIATQYDCKVMDIDAIAQSDEIDGVLICTPTDTHADLIEKFVAAGKVIFCEKPIDLSVDRVRQCLKMVEHHKGKLMMGFNRRFDPHFAAAQNQITSGAIGEIEMLTIISRDPGLPPYDYIKTSGGIFRDMAIHDFDIARFFLSEEIDEVCATVANLIDPELDNLGDYAAAQILLKTASGKQAMISNSRRASYGYDQRVEALGSKGAVSVNNQREVDIQTATKDGYQAPPLLDFFMSRYVEAYAAEIAAFVEYAKGENNSVPVGEDGLKALLIAEAALKSVQEKRTVKISEVDL